MMVVSVSLCAHRLVLFPVTFSCGGEERPAGRETRVTRKQFFRVIVKEVHQYHTPFGVPDMTSVKSHVLADVAVAAEEIHAAARGDASATDPGSKRCAVSLRCGWTGRPRRETSRRRRREPTVSSGSASSSGDPAPSIS